jgi:biotin carboxyl carrier protein
MRRYTIEVDATTYVVDVQELAADRFQVVVGDAIFEVRLAADEDLAEATITPAILPIHLPPAATREQAARATPTGAPVPQAAVRPRHPAAAHNSGYAELVAPLPGTIVSIAVAPGERVEQGQALLVLEAMKMNNTVTSPSAAMVAEVLVQNGQTVQHGDVLLRFM